MKINFKFYFSCLLIFCFSLFHNCLETKKPDNDSFTFITKGEYVVDNYNGLSVYRLKNANKIMNGYFVVGNEFSKWEEFNVKEGLLHGDYIIFHSNGNIYSHSLYSNGKLNGEEKIYFPSGALKKVKTYRNNEPHGQIVEYFETGQVAFKSKIVNGKKTETVQYDILGNIKYQEFIKDGHTIKQKISAGKVVSEEIISNYDNFNAFKFYDKNGDLEIYFRVKTIDNNTAYIIELDSLDNEIKQVDLSSNPSEALKYKHYLNR